jgi:ribulose-phosphate 3-epimerase
MFATILSNLDDLYVRSCYTICIFSIGNIQMAHTIEIAPSILSADFSQLGEEVKAIEHAGADLIHLDIMDGHFVPNITFGPQIVKALRPLSKLPFDVHLMISPVDLFIEAFAIAGADIITVHPEAGPHTHRTLQLIKSFGKKTGISLNPGTPASSVQSLLEDIDQILIMTVNPGFGGQSFLTSQLKKIREVRAMIDHSGRPITLEVDGGINPETANQAIEAGATRLVAGTAVFTGEKSAYRKNIADLRLKI